MTPRSAAAPRARKLFASIAAALIPAVLLAAAVAHADAAPPSPDSALVVHLGGDRQWKPVPPPLPAGAQVSPVALDPATKGSIAYARIPAGAHLPMHWHSHHEYTVFLSGKGTLTVDGKANEVEAGAYIVIPPKVHHELKCAEGAECVLLTRRPGPTDYHWVK